MTHATTTCKKDSTAPKPRDMPSDHSQGVGFSASTEDPPNKHPKPPTGQKDIRKSHAHENTSYGSAQNCLVQRVRDQVLTTLAGKEPHISMEAPNDKEVECSDDREADNDIARDIAISGLEVVLFEQGFRKW